MTDEMDRDQQPGPSLTEVILMGASGVFNALMNSSGEDLVVAQAIYQTVGTLMQVEAVKLQAQQEALARQAAAENPRGRLIAMPPRV